MNETYPLSLLIVDKLCLAHNMLIASCHLTTEVA